VGFKEVYFNVQHLGKPSKILHAFAKRQLFSVVFGVVDVAENYCPQLSEIIFGDFFIS
jgi:hypothetical protein